MRAIPQISIALAVGAGIPACGVPGRRAFDARRVGASEITHSLSDIDGHLTAYAVGEDRSPTIIYVHGTPGSARAWERYLADPVAGARSIAVDRPGFGRSMSRPLPSLDAQARALEGLLPTEGDPGAILVGHSLGGPIVAWAASIYPERVAGVVILAGSLDPGQERINPLQYLARVPPIEYLLPSWASTSNRELLALKGDLERLGGMLESVRVPVAIVHGTKDRLVPYANVGYMLERFRGARLRRVRLEGANHFIPWTHEAVVREAIEWTLRAAAGEQDAGALDGDVLMRGATASVPENGGSPRRLAALRPCS